MTHGPVLGCGPGVGDHCTSREKVFQPQGQVYKRGIWLVGACCHEVCVHGDFPGALIMASTLAGAKHFPSGVSMHPKNVAFWSWPTHTDLWWAQLQADHRHPVKVQFQKQNLGEQRQKRWDLINQSHGISSKIEFRWGSYNSCLVSMKVL